MRLKCALKKAFKEVGGGQRLSLSLYFALALSLRTSEGELKICDDMQKISEGEREHARSEL